MQISSASVPRLDLSLWFSFLFEHEPPDYVLSNRRPSRPATENFSSFSSSRHSDQNRIPLAMVQTMKKLKSGYINGTRVMLGNLCDFLNTSAITDLSFLGSQEDGYPDSE